MDYNYIIEVTMPDTGEIKYLTTWNGLTSDPNGAKRFRKNSAEATHKLNNLPRNLNPRLVDRHMVIGTYISTYNGKFRFKKIVDTACKNNVTAILILPILVLIGLIVRLRYETIKLSDKYVTNNR